MQKLVADPTIQPHALRHLLDICSGPFAQRCDLVDEGDLGREKGVGGVFDHFSTFQVGRHDWKITQEKGAINLCHHLGGTVGLDTDDNAIRLHKVINRRPFTQEFGVGGNIEIKIGIGLAHGLFHLPVCADRDRGFGDDDHIILGRLRDFLRSGHHIGQVRMAIAAPGGRANGYENRFGPVDGLGQIKGEGQPPRRNILGHQRIKTRLVNRNLTAFQHGNFVGVLVDAHNVMSKVGKTHTRDQADIACPDHRNFHGCLPYSLRLLLAFRRAARGEASTFGPVRGPPRIVQVVPNRSLHRCQAGWARRRGDPRSRVGAWYSDQWESCGPQAIRHAVATTPTTREVPASHGCKRAHRGALPSPPLATSR
mmetsp:Transcript_27227/g.49807  ORF Transcript_27227/g.49807 Transcript_27227/m.49807 type:complete len:367 (+) Transcript_27227:993-2093(+)